MQLCHLFPAYVLVGGCACVCVCMCVCVCACVCLAAQSCLTLCNLMDYSMPALLSLGFSRQEYWSGLPFPAPGNLPDPGIEPASLANVKLFQNHFLWCPIFVNDLRISWVFSWVIQHLKWGPVCNAHNLPQYWVYPWSITPGQMH